MRAANKRLAGARYHLNRKLFVILFWLFSVYFSQTSLASDPPKSPLPLPWQLLSVHEGGGGDESIGFGDVVVVNLCGPEDVATSTADLDLKLVLAGVTVLDKPRAKQVSWETCVLQKADEKKKLPKVLGRKVGLAYKLAYDKDSRANWMFVFDQRDNDKCVALSFRKPNDQMLPLAEVTSAKVQLHKRGHWPIALSLLALIGLSAWLFLTNRKTNILRDTTYDPKRFLSARIQELRNTRAAAEAERLALVVKLKEKSVADAETIVPNIVPMSPESREKAYLSLRDSLTKHSITEPDERLKKLFASYDAALFAGAQFQKDMADSFQREPTPTAAEQPHKALAGVPVSSATDPLTNTDGFLAEVEKLKQRPRYSLGRCQMAWWTVLIVSGFVLTYFATWTLFELPESVLWLMGISFATAGASFAINDKSPSKSLPKPSVGFLKDILADPEGNDAFSRWQILVWTVLLGLIIGFDLVKNFVFTDFSPTLLGLLGISAGTYLGFKFPERNAQSPRT